ncbi:MAG: hypothetical protein MRY72_12910 [Aquisalinus sp.]|nr:hypothetical protein [Aquisalinus sp.]
MRGKNLEDLDLLARTPEESELMLDAAFMELFDDRTLYYDIIPGIDQSGVIICPPLDEDALQALQRQITDVDEVEFYQFRRCTKLHISHIRSRDDLVSEQTLQLLQALKKRSPKNILYTLQKDNHPLWVKDWVEHYASACHADFAVIYDNGSTQYTVSELSDELSKLDIPFFILSVPYKYGPSKGAQNPNWGFHSMFLQDSCLEHFREAVLSAGLGDTVVLNVDIDEILFSTDLHDRNVFDACRASESGCIRFYGVYTYLDFSNSDSQSLPRLAQHVLADKTSLCTPAKYAFQPGRLLPSSFLTPHRIGIRKDRKKNIAFLVPDKAYCYWHCRSINTGWKNPNRSNKQPKGSKVFTITDLSKVSQNIGSEIWDVCVRPRYAKELEGKNVAEKFSIAGEVQPDP